jgi:hypothetical protein
MFGLVIALLIIVLIFVFSSHNSQTIKSATPIAAYANNLTAQAAVLIDGPEAAASEHNQVQIIITNSSATLNIISGYNSRVTNTKVYANNEAAFHVFLRSLEYSQFDVGRNSPNLSQASGYCPLGDRYIFTFNVNGIQKERYWITNCNGDPHTFNGNLTLTLQLFQNQIPGYQNLVANLNI